MARINPELISQVQAEVEQNAAQFQGDGILERLVSDMKAQIKASTFLEAFPQGAEDYNACISYLAKTEPGDPQVEEMSQDIKGRVAAAQEAWEEVFYKPTAVSRSRGGRQMFFVTHAMNQNPPGEAGLAKLQEEAENPSQAVHAVADSFLGWARSEMPQGSHAQGYRVYRNSEMLDSELGYDVEGNTMPLAEMEQLIQDSMAVILSALDTLDKYRLALSKIFDEDQEQAECQLRTFVPVSVKTSLGEEAAEELLKSELGGLSPKGDLHQLPQGVLSGEIVYMGPNVLFLEQIEDEDSNSGSMEVQINIRFSVAADCEEEQIQEYAAELSSIAAAMFAENYVVENAAGSVVLRGSGPANLESVRTITE